LTVHGAIHRHEFISAEQEKGIKDEKYGYILGEI